MSYENFFSHIPSFDSDLRRKAELILKAVVGMPSSSIYFRNTVGLCSAIISNIESTKSKGNSGNSFPLTLLWLKLLIHLLY